MTKQQRFAIVPAVYVLMWKDGKVLLIRRANTGYYDGFYAFPSGHVEGSEGAKQAGVRETKEEVGVDVPEQAMKFVHVIHRKAEEGDHERVDFAFEATSWQGEPYNAEPHKCDDVQWFSLDALPKNLAPVTKQMLEKIEAGEMYSEDNFEGA